MEQYNVAVAGRERCDDWTTLDEALEQAAAFLGLGCKAVTIEQRAVIKRSDLLRAKCPDCNAPILVHPVKPSRCLCGALYQPPVIDESDAR